MRLKIFACKVILFAQLILSLCPDVVLAEKVLNVIIVANTNDEPYLEAINGFKEQLSKTQHVRFTDIFLAQNKNPDMTLSSEIKDNKPDLIYSLGGESTETAMRNTLTTPIVATMILKRF